MNHPIPDICSIMIINLDSYKLSNKVNEYMEKGEVILYQPNETIRLEVRLEEESVWLTRQQ